MQPLVSVFVLTYNHEKYIEQALDGILNQKVNFNYEIVIGDDYSTDATRSILLQYQTRNPDKINLLLHPHNLGAMVNQLATIKACKGKYMAICEGDDYWTDCFKLQRQIDFLETNPEYSVCFHNVEYRYHSEKIPSVLALSIEEPTTSSFRDLAIRNNYIPTCSVVYRNKFSEEFIELLKISKIGDWVLSLFISQTGKIHYIPNVMGVYRVHSGGVWGKLNKEERFLLLMDTIDKLILFFGKSPEHVQYLNEGKRILTKKHKQQKSANGVIQKTLSFIKKTFMYCTPYYLVIKFKSK